MRAFERHAREERSRALGKLTGGERAFLERNRQVRFDLDAEMFILGGDPNGLCDFDDQFPYPVQVAVDFHPDVRRLSIIGI